MVHVDSLACSENTCVHVTLPQEKGIGQDFALYYEACAAYYELKGNFQSADAVYVEGTRR